MDVSFPFKFNYKEACFSITTVIMSTIYPWTFGSVNTFTNLKTCIFNCTYRLVIWNKILWKCTAILRMAGKRYARN